MTREKPLKLTSREKEVLRLMEEGLSRKIVASRLVISIRTVDFHTNNTYRKLKASSITSALKEARRLGLLAVASFLLLSLTGLPGEASRRHKNRHSNKPTANRVRKGQVKRISFYCGSRNDDPSRKTASGRPWKAPKGYLGAAAGHNIPFGSILTIDGFRQKFIVDDRGGAIGPNDIDVRLPGYYCICSNAKHGIQYKRVRVTRPGKGGGRNA